MRSNDIKIILAIVFAVALDQITKVMIRSAFVLHESIRVMGDFVRITYVENPGMAFGIRVGGRAFFTVFAIVASIAIVIYMFKIRNERFLPRFALGLILSGAIGNLTDRIIFGQVTDFIDIGWWPVFNVADISVSIGMMLLIFLVLIDKDAKESSVAEPEQIVR